jgi:hypothetical protein
MGLGNENVLEGLESFLLRFDGDSFIFETPVFRRVRGEGAACILREIYIHIYISIQIYSYRIIHKCMTSHLRWEE